MSISAFIPIKKFSDSKLRLTPILNPDEREQLASKMVNQTIDALKDSNIAACKNKVKGMKKIYEDFGDI